MVGRILEKEYGVLVVQILTWLLPRSLNACRPLRSEC